jgi:hypothetical protein
MLYPMLWLTPMLWSSHTIQTTQFNKWLMKLSKPIDHIEFLKQIIWTKDTDNTVQPSSSTWPRPSTPSITAFLSADSTALVSQMTASPGSPTTSQIEFSVSNRRACCPDLWQSLWGCHRVQFLGQLFSLYTSMMSLLLLVILWSTYTQTIPFGILLALLWTLC